MVALRPRKAGLVAPHVKSNRTARGGFRILIFIDHLHKLSRSNQSMKKQSQTPPPKFSQGTQYRAAPHLYLTILSSFAQTQDRLGSPGWTSTTTEQQDLYTRKNQTTRHNRRDRPASTCERYTQGGVVTAYKMKGNIPTPAGTGQEGDGKVTKSWHKAAAPIPGLGCNYIARTTAVAFKGPDHQNIDHAVASVFSCANGRW